MLPGQGEAPLGGDVAGQDQHRAVGAEAGAVQGNEVGLADPRQRRRRAAGRMPPGTAAVGQTGRGQAGHRPRVGVAHLERVEGLVAQPVELGRREGRLARHLGHQAERRAQPRRRHGDRHQRLAPAGAALQRAAQRLGRRRDLRRGAAPGALGQQVGGHRGQAGKLRRVELAAREHDQHRRHQRHPLARRDDDAHAVRQGLLDRSGDRQRPRGGGRRRRLERLGRRRCRARAAGARRDSANARKARPFIASLLPAGSRARRCARR